MTAREDDREEVLAAIAAALGDEPARGGGRRPARARPGVSADAESLAESLARGGCEVERIGGADDLPGRVRELADRHGLRTRIAVGDRELAALDWKGAGLRASLKWSEGETDVAVTRCMAAIAETGQFLVANDGEDARLSLLADTHAVLVEPSQVRASLDDLGDILGAAPPGLVTLVAGPSRTADIEQTIVLGAHGPRRVAAFIAGG